MSSCSTWMRWEESTDFLAWLWSPGGVREGHLPRGWGREPTTQECRGRTWDKGLPPPTSGSLTLSLKKLATNVLTLGPEDRSLSGPLKETVPTFQGTGELWPSGSWRGAGRAQLSETHEASQKEVPGLRSHQCSQTPCSELRSPRESWLPLI